MIIAASKAVEPNRSSGYASLGDGREHVGVLRALEGERVAAPRRDVSRFDVPPLGGDEAGEPIGGAERVRAQARVGAGAGTHVAARGREGVAEFSGAGAAEQHQPCRQGTPHMRLILGHGWLVYIRAFD